MSQIRRELYAIHQDFDRNYLVPKPFTSIQSIRYDELRAERFLKFIEEYTLFTFSLIEAVLLIDYMQTILLNDRIIKAYLNKNNNKVNVKGEIKDVTKDVIYVFSRFIINNGNYQYISVKDFIKNTQLHGNVVGIDLNICLNYDESFTNQMSNLSVEQKVSVDIILDSNLKFYNSDSFYSEHHNKFYDNSIVRLFEESKSTWTGYNISGKLFQMTEVIVKQSQEIKENNESDSRCFIATACYGHYDANEVVILRKYRDNVLLTNLAGKLFVQFYYLISPAFAVLISRSNFLKHFIREFLLARLISRIDKKN